MKGGLHDFQEVWPDEGDVNMFKLAQTLYSVGYPYMLMPDHAPSHPDHSVPEQPGKGVPFAFQFGYIIAVIQAVKIASLAGKPEVLNDLQVMCKIVQSQIFALVNKFRFESHLGMHGDL
eukprot:SAG31_NODE_2234_length_6128_cov_44.016752_4_plen_119_part_00